MKWFIFFWGKRGRPVTIDFNHLAGDGQPVTDALNLVIPPTMEDFFDRLSEEQWEKMNKSLLDAKQATKVMVIFEVEYFAMANVEDWIV